MNPALMQLITVLIQALIQLAPVLAKQGQLVIKLINKGSVDLTPEELIEIDEANKSAHAMLQEEVAKNNAEMEA